MVSDMYTYTTCEGSETGPTEIYCCLDVRLSRLTTGRGHDTTPNDKIDLAHLEPEHLLASMKLLVIGLYLSPTR